MDECYNFKQDIHDDQVNEIFLTFDDIKEDIENTTIFIHEKGLTEDISSYLTIDVCN